MPTSLRTSGSVVAWRSSRPSSPRRKGELLLLPRVGLLVHEVPRVGTDRMACGTEVRALEPLSTARRAGPGPGTLGPARAADKLEDLPTTDSILAGSDGAAAWRHLPGDDSVRRPAVLASGNDSFGHATLPHRRRKGRGNHAGRSARSLWPHAEVPSRSVNAPWRNRTCHDLTAETTSEWSVPAMPR